MAKRLVTIPAAVYLSDAQITVANVPSKVNPIPMGIIKNKNSVIFEDVISLIEEGLKKANDALKQEPKNNQINH